MNEFNEKPFAVFKGKTGESIKAVYSGEQKEDAEKILALVNLRDSLRRFLAESGQAKEVGAGPENDLAEEEDPVEILQEVKSMLGIAQTMAGHVAKDQFAPAAEAVEKLDRMLGDEDTRNEVIHMLLEGKTSRDIRWMLDERPNKVPGPTIGRAVSNLFAYRSKTVEFIKKYRPETTDAELKKLYAKLP